MKLSTADFCHTTFGGDQIEVPNSQQSSSIILKVKTHHGLAQTTIDTSGPDASEYDDLSDAFLQCLSPVISVEEDFDFDFDVDLDFFFNDLYGCNDEQSAIYKSATSSTPSSIAECDLHKNVIVGQTYQKRWECRTNCLPNKRTKFKMEQGLAQNLPFRPTQPTKRKRATHTFAIRQETRSWHCTGKTKTYTNHIRSDGEWTECPNEGCCKLIKWDSKNNLKCEHCKIKIHKMKEANINSAGLHWRWVRCGAENCKAMYIYNRGKRLRRSADKCRLLNSCQI